MAEHQLPKANPQDIVCLAKGIASLEVAVPHSLDKSLDRRAAALLQDFSSQVARCQSSAPVPSILLWARCDGSVGERTNTAG